MTRITIIGILLLALVLVCHITVTHADNLSKISWQPYSQAIFNQAKNQHRNIVIIAKTSWCHWCQKLEATTLVNPAVVNMLNKNFIAVQFDVDQNQSLAIRYHVIDLPTIIIVNENNKILATKSGYMNETAFSQFLDNTSKMQVNASSNQNNREPVVQLPDTIRTQLEERQHELFHQNMHTGGYGHYAAVDFPSIEYALYAANQGDQVAWQWLFETVRNQYLRLDQVWGGIYEVANRAHQYQITYDKKLVTQANNMRYSIVGFAYLHNLLLLTIARNIDGYISHFLTNENGTFYAGQNAHALSASANIKYYQMNDAGRKKLGIPAINNSIVTSDNAYAISGYAYMYMFTGDKSYLLKATRASSWILKNLRTSDGGFRHDSTSQQIGNFSDQIEMVKAMLTLYKITLDKAYLQQAEQTMQYIMKNFLHYNQANNKIAQGQSCIKSYEMPENNLVLIREARLLYLYTNNVTYMKIANTAMSCLMQVQSLYSEHPALLLDADRLMRNHPLRITIIGKKSDSLANQLFLAALKYPTFYSQIKWYENNRDAAKASNMAYPALSVAAAYICYDNHCSLPVSNPQQISATINKMTFTYEHAALPATVASSQTGKIYNNKMENTIFHTLTHYNYSLIIITFWLIGLLLGFTPCLLPLTLILVTLLNYQCNELSRFKILMLTLTYVTTFSLSYAIAGLSAAIYGFYIQQYIQKTWVIILMSGIFILLSLSLLGFYTLKLPPKLKYSVVRFNSVKGSGTYIGAALMAIIVTLLAAPCAAAPLICTLGYIVRTGDITLGLFALFIMGLGICTPLMLVTLIGHQFTINNKIKPFQEAIKIFFGLSLLAIGFWFLTSIVSSFWNMMLWYLLAMLTAVYMGIFSPLKQGSYWKFWKILSITIFLYAIALFFGALLGSNNPLQPIRNTYQMNDTFKSENQPAIYANSISDVNRVIVKGINLHRPVIIFIYANWCIECKKIETTIISDPKVQQLMKKFVIAKVDLSVYNQDKIAILKQYKVIAPPAMIFFDTNGHRINISLPETMTVATFSQLLHQVVHISLASQ